MSDLSITIVEGYHCTGADLDLSGTDFWGFALDQRAFGPRQLVVVTARGDGAVVGLAHCDQTELPELALKCCLAALDDGAAAAVAYSDEPVSTDRPIGLRDRLDRARVAAREFGVHLVDWIMCDDTQMRSIRFALEDCDQWWDAPDAGPGPPTDTAIPAALDVPTDVRRHTRARKSRGRLGH
jgi:hypothetical protein